MIFSAVSLLLVIVLLKPERPMEDAESIRFRYEELGAISVPEKRAMTILALILVGFVTDRMHGVDPAWIMISATAAFFLPGIRLMDGEKFSRLAFPLLFFITGAMAIGATAVTIGISKETGALFASMLSGSSFAAALFAYAFGIFSSFFIQSVALVGAFVPPLIDTAETLGISPYAVVYSFLRGTDQVIFPYQFAVLAYVCSFGYIKHSHLILVMGVRIVLDTFLLMGLAYPYWKWIGIV
jgi:di/tricarboxylate transporter